MHIPHREQFQRMALIPGRLRIKTSHRVLIFDLSTRSASLLGHLIASANDNCQGSQMVFCGVMGGKLELVLADGFRMACNVDSCVPLPPATAALHHHRCAVRRCCAVRRFCVIKTDSSNAD